MGRMTIITPSYRINNLKIIYDNMNFDYIDEWIIVYDGSKISENTHLFNHDKIKEFNYKGEGIDGNQQRNYGISQIKNEDTYIYFLDDDNIIHPNLYRLLDIIENNKFYTFNQSNTHNFAYRDGIMYGNDIRVGKIDTAMFICHYSLVKGIMWMNHAMGADGEYIVACYTKNKDKYVYINSTLAYYNVLPR